MEFAPQQVPGAGRRDAEGARQIRGEEHMWKAHPGDRAENNLAPIGGDESAVLNGLADRRLHPAVVDHDPEGRKCGAQRDHRGREQVEPGRYSLPAEQKNPEEACLEGKARSGPCIGPDTRENSLQFVPSSKAITMPETTPSPKAMPKILSQNSNTVR